MVVRKKGDTSTASADAMTMTTTMTPPQDEVAAEQGIAANNKDNSVDIVIDGQHEVDLLDLSISAEDIAAMRRVDACLEEVRRANRQALQEGAVNPQMITRAKGKETMLIEAERQEQYNKLREEELRCKALQEKLQAQRLLLEKMQAPPPPPPKDTAATNPLQHVPPRVRPRVIPVQEIFDHS